MKKILAIDLGKFKSVACFYKPGSEKQRYKTFFTNRLEMANLIRDYKPDCVVIEICSIAGWVYDLVKSMSIEIKVANTNDRRWRWGMTRKKTDRHDALRLAKLTYLGELPEVHIPTVSVRQKRSLINYRQGLTKRLTQVKNNIRAILDVHELEIPGGKKGWSKKNLMILEQWSCPVQQCGPEELWRGELYMELSLFEHISELLLEVEQKLKSLNAKDKNVQLLKTVPGVGERLAEVVAAYIDEPERFSNGKQVGCYAGLTPRQFQSGNMNRQGRISGEGNKLLRSFLVEVCWLGLRWNPWILDTYERIRKGFKTRKKIAIIAVARRLLVRMWAMMRDGTRWRWAKLAGSQ